MSAEIQELLQSLTHTTSRLAREQGQRANFERALGERMRAIAAIREWIGQEPSAARLMGKELTRELQRNLDQGTQILLRLAMAREVMRNDRMAIDRQIQLLQGMRGLGGATRKSLSCRG